MPDDSELLRRYAEEKSEAAFAELVQRHVNFVYACALRRVGGDAHLAEDVTQQVFTALARDAARLAEREVLSGWLFTTARNASAQVVRTERRRLLRETEAQLMNDLTSTSVHDAEWEKLRPVLDDALDRLSDDDRQAVLLRFFEGKSFADVGAKLRLTENTARMRVERALDKLHALLTRRGVTSTSAALAVALANQAGVAAPAGLAANVTGAALAGASVGGGVAAGLVTFMGTSKMIAGVAGLAAVLAIGVAVFQTQAARSSTAALAAIQGERDEIQARLLAAEKRARAPSGSPVAASSMRGESRADRAPPTEATASGSSAWQPAGLIDQVITHPETRAAFVSQQVMAAKAHFERFFKTAGLSAEQQEAFLRCVAQQAEAKLDLTASIRAQGYGPNHAPQDPEAFRRLMRLDAEAEEDFQGKLRAQLGEEHYRQFSAYRATIEEMNVADQLAGRLYETDTPLTPQQAGELVRTLKDNRYRAAATMTPRNTLNGTFISDALRQGAMVQSNLQNGSVTFTLLEWPAPVTDAAMAQAEKILAPSQYAVLEQFQARQAAQLLMAPLPATLPDTSKLMPKTPGAR